MTISPEQVSNSSRRKGAILFCAQQRHSETELVLEALAGSNRTTLAVSHSESAFLTDLEREKGLISLVVLDGNLANVVALVRAAASTSPMCEIALLATETEQREIQQQLGLAARLGSHWRFVSPSGQGLGKTLQNSYQSADQRRTTRTTLDRFNARLTPAVDAIDTKQLRQLVISDRFLSSVLESAFDAVMMVDGAGVIVAFNPSAEQLFGRSQSQAISHPIGSLVLGPWQRDIGAVLDRSLAGELFQSSFLRDETERYVEFAATPVYDASRNKIAVSLIVRDITQRIQSENVLRTTEKLAAVGRLASSIAHEINNPLEAVTNLVYLARITAQNPETQEYLDQTDQELRRMTAITAQTLRFHRQSTQTQVVTAQDLFESVLGVYRGRFANARMRVETRFRADSPVSCYEGEIRQVLNNLVGNALDAMQGSGGQLFIRSRDGLDWRDGDRGLVLTIADTGPGMSKKTVEKIFEPFYTTKGTLGTGLGLWISSEIIARHRGRLRVRSRQSPVASGTVFTVFLPYDAVLR